MSKRIPEVKAWDDGTVVMEKNCVPMWRLGCAAINALEAERDFLADKTVPATQRDITNATYRYETAERKLGDVRHGLKQAEAALAERTTELDRWRYLAEKAIGGLDIRGKKP